MRIITKTNHPTNSSAGSSIIKSCIELRDDMISSQYALYQIIPVTQFFDTARMGIASQCVDAGFILFWPASMVQYLLLWVAKQHLRAFG